MENLTGVTEEVNTFFDALADAGIAPSSPSALVADGLIHRHHIEGDNPGSLNGWHVLHLDSPASGAGGSWKAGHSVKWCSKRLSALTASESAEIARRITEDRKRAQVAQEARHKDAAARALRVWNQSQPASPAHPYLVRKGVAPGIARQSGASLVLPVQDFTGQLWGLQFIQPDGSKRFISGMAKKGHFIPTGGHPDGNRPLWIAEGHATAATIQAMRPNVCTIAACDAGNLHGVAIEARKRWPSVSLVVCPDFDAIGTTKGVDAAIAARARLLPPPAMIPEGASDWNDWANHRREVA